MGPWERDPSRHQRIAHAGDQEAAKAAPAVGDAERGIAGVRPAHGPQLNEPLEYLVDRRCDATARTASLTAFSAGLRVSGTRGTIALSVMPRFWYWTAAVATVFVFAGMVIAITKLV